MDQNFKPRDDEGFSMLELMIALTVMLVLAGASIALMRDSLKVAVATYELTDAQEALRTAQEYVNRDLINAGDGLNSLSNIHVTSNFKTNYISKDTSVDVDHFGILTSDDNVPAGTTILGASPATTVRSTPNVTDRISILARDASFNNGAPVTPVSVDSTGTNIQVAAGEESKFVTGEVYFLSSSAGATFCTITSITGVGTTTPKLVFANGDTFGLNVTGTTGLVRTIANGGATSLVRMQIIHYYVNSNGLLMRRVFGVKGTGFTESPIAEHIVALQFRYVLDMVDGSGYVVQPTRQLTSTQQTATRQVEVTVTAETPHSM